MAEPLKDRIDDAAIDAVFARFHDVSGGVGIRFDVAAARARCRGYTQFELKARAAYVADAISGTIHDLHDADADDTVALIARALATPLVVDAMVYFIHDALLQRWQEHADFDVAMSANVALTERFTAEFSIRPLLERDPERAIAHLQALSTSANEHHRRLVSEGTRPRLPWASRLPTFSTVTAPIDALLLALSADDVLYVRRSVANHIGDIAKIDLDRALELCARIDNSWVKTHALRHPVKLGDPRALALLGFRAGSGAGAIDVVVRGSVVPAVVDKGGSVAINVDVVNGGDDDENVVIDLVVDYVKKDGSTSPKTFKLKTMCMPGTSEITLRKTLSTADLSTRVHWPGVHRVAVQINGVSTSIGAFRLR